MKNAEELWRALISNRPLKKGETEIEYLENRLNERLALIDDYATIREKEIKDKIIRLFPTTWLDPLLSGDKAINVPADCPDIEKLLQAIKDRIEEWYTKHKEQ